jgi:RNA polymerase sigma-70 factor (ECF subfamily)
MGIILISCPPIVPTVTTLASTTDDVGSLYSSHHGWLHNWLWRKLGCRDGAADIAHDTFVRLLDAGTVETLREPRAYLSTIANGLLVNHWRRLTLERAYLEALALQDAALEPSPEERALTLEALMQVDAMLAKLSSKAREAFLLSQIDGLTYAAIAEHLQVSERMVKKYMAQAMLQCLLISNQ